MSRAITENRAYTMSRCHKCDKVVFKDFQLRGRIFFEPTKRYFCKECFKELKKAGVIYE